MGLGYVESPLGPDISCLWPHETCSGRWRGLESEQTQSQISRDNPHLLHTLAMMTNPAVGLGLIDAGQGIKEEPT